MRRPQVVALLAAFALGALAGWLRPRGAESTASAQTSAAERGNAAVLAVAPAPEVEWRGATVLRRAEDLLARLPDLPPAALERLLPKLVAEGRGMRDAILATLLKLAETEPRRALQAAAALPADGQADEALERIFALLLAREADAARLRAAFSGASREAVERAFRRASARRDPASALAAGADAESVGVALVTLVEREGCAAAAERVRELPAALREPAAKVVARRWARLDPVGALRWAESLPAESQLMEELWNVAIDAHPAAAAAALAIRPESEILRKVADVVRAWSRHDFPAARAWVETQASDAIQREAFPSLLDEWVALDPVGALARARVLDLRDPQLFWSLVGRATSAWTELDPTAAAAWVKSLPAGAERHAAFNGWVLGGSDLLPRLMLECWQGTPEEMSSLLSAAFAGWALAEPDAALAWLQPRFGKSGSGDLLASLIFSGLPRPRLAEILKGWSAAQPSVELIEGTQLVDGGTLSHSWREFVRAYAVQDLPAAAAWTAALPAFQQCLASRAVVEAWVLTDPEAAFRWAAGLSPWGRAEALGLAAAALTFADPSRAVALAGTLSDPDARRHAFRGIRREWRQIDPAAAAAWMARNRPDLGPPLVGGPRDEDED